MESNMALSGSEAASALAEIENVQRRTNVAAGYSLASPHLITWGLVWLVGYTACGLLPVERWSSAWLPLIAIGTSASILFGVRAGARSRTPRTGPSWKSILVRSVGGAMALTVCLSCIALFLQPASPNADLVLPAFVLGLVYALVGLVTLPRYFWIGAAVFASTMAGYWLTRPFLPFWIAVAGGGGLILGGLWLRKV
jgi:hypothetical protein